MHTLHFRFAALLLLAAALCGCKASRLDEAAQPAWMQVTCTAPNGAQVTLDRNAEPPAGGAACQPGSPFSLTYDNRAGYKYVAVCAVTHDEVVWLLPSSKDGSSVTIEPNAQRAPLGQTFTMPNRLRDLVAMFSNQPMTAKDIEQHLREVTLAQMPALEVRVRISADISPM